MTVHDRLLPSRDAPMAPHAAEIRWNEWFIGLHPEIPKSSPDLGVRKTNNPEQDMEFVFSSHRFVLDFGMFC